MDGCRDLSRRLRVGWCFWARVFVDWVMISSSVVWRADDGYRCYVILLLQVF